jgi:DNA-binding response OmpR family regulator
MSIVLVVEDDETIGRVLESRLRAHRHDVVWVRTGTAALRTAGQRDFDLVLLDLGLPDLDGFEVCRELRSVQRSAVLVILTARDEEIDVVLGLEAGADDYLTKPFRLTELLARVRAHLRRGPAANAPVRVLRVGGLEVDTGSRRVCLDQHPVILRAKEFDLLVRFAATPDTAISRTELMADVWDENWFGSTKTLDVHLSSLRRKLADVADENGTRIRSPEIVTLRGRGYRLDTPSN